MTTTDTANKYRYQGNGSTDTFAFSGRVFATTDLVVEIILRADDSLVETLTINTDYTVTIASNGTASVQVTNATKIPSSLEDILLRRVLAQSQSVSLPTGTVFPAKVVETGLDRGVALVQDLDEAIGRSLKLPPQTSATVALTVEPEDDKILAWDGTTGQLKNGPTTASFTTATNTAVAAAATATTQAGIAATQAGIATSAASSATNQVSYATEWAINPEDDPVSVAAGGDNTTTFSALHWAAKAADSAASVNLPALGAANTVLQVNAAGNALEYEKVKALNVDINAATDTVITASDEIWFADATDSSLVKKDTVQGILDLFRMPVGSIYMNASVSTNPATLLGYGTWTALGVDRVLIGVGSTYPTAGATGGSLTQTLAETNLGAHRHLHGVFSDTQSNTAYKAGGAATRQSFATATTTSGSGSTDIIGSGTAFSIVQSYEVVYMWKRTV